MTEKRFYYAHGIIFDTHKDNHINKIGTIKDLDIGLRLVNWLNELNDENEQLKQFREQNIQEYTKLKKMCNVCKKENEQLKEEIKDLNDVLARYEEKELEE